MAKIYNVFISHSWDHVSDLMSLRRLLENRGYFHVNFLETPPHDPIDSYSEWMKWELDTAIEERKPILGVIPWGQINVSSVIQQRAKECVRWNTESIVDAIRRLG